VRLRPRLRVPVGGVRVADVEIVALVRRLRPDVAILGMGVADVELLLLPLLHLVLARGGGRRIGGLGMGRRLGGRHLCGVAVHTGGVSPCAPFQTRIALPSTGAARFALAQGGYGLGMNNPEETSKTKDEEQRQEAGQREQGVRTEDSDDLSSPQLTEDADEKR
jgi:hypothetical protein